MKRICCTFILVAALIASCQQKINSVNSDASKNPIEGTWKLVKIKKVMESFSPFLHFQNL
jgi:hypothetical protein